MNVFSSEDKEDFLDTVLETEIQNWLDAGIWIEGED